MPVTMANEVITEMVEDSIFLWLLSVERNRKKERIIWA
jgi:hypothetical protein